MPEPFPTMEQVERANREQIARWYCFLAVPKSPGEQGIADRIADRFLNMGGLTPGLSRKIGLIEKPQYSRVAHDSALRIANSRVAGRSVERRVTKPAVRSEATYKPAQLFKVG